MVRPTWSASMSQTGIHQKTQRRGEPTMSISVLGIDIGKNNFHLFGVDAEGKKVFRNKLTRGDSYVRSLLVHGARAVMSRLKNQNDRCKKWVDQLNSRSHSNIAAVGLANKLARIAWVIMSRQEVYRAI